MSNDISKYFDFYLSACFFAVEPLLIDEGSLSINAVNAVRFCIIFIIFFNCFQCQFSNSAKLPYEKASRNMSPNQGTVLLPHVFLFAFLNRNVPTVYTKLIILG